MLVIVPQSVLETSTVPPLYLPVYFVVHIFTMGILTNLSIFLATTASVHAGYSATSKSNVVLYWGQNSAGQQSTQSRLSTYCAGELKHLMILFV
jgi:hypothetical protein